MLSCLKLALPLLIHLAKIVEQVIRGQFVAGFLVISQNSLGRMSFLDGVVSGTALCLQTRKRRFLILCQQIGFMLNAILSFLSHFHPPLSSNLKLDQRLSVDLRPLRALFSTLQVEVVGRTIVRAKVAMGLVLLA